MKKIMILLIVFLTAQYSYSQVNHDASVIGQNNQDCTVPIHVTADSLCNYYWVPNLSQEKHRPRYYNNSWNHRLDTAFAKCQDYLIDRLGFNVYCNYVKIRSYGLGIIPPNNYILMFLFRYPGSDQNRVMTFRLKLAADSSVIIDYPENVPDCHGLPDCGFIISKEMALKLAKDAGFIKDGDKYSMGIDEATSCWIISKTLTEGWTWDRLSIQLQTGEIKHLGIEQRID